MEPQSNRPKIITHANTVPILTRSESESPSDIRHRAVTVASGAKLYHSMSKDEIKRVKSSEKGKKKFFKMIAGSKLSTIARGGRAKMLKNLTPEEIGWLIEGATANPPTQEELAKLKENSPKEKEFVVTTEIKNLAVSTLVSLAYPVEKIPGIRAQILDPSNKLLDCILRYASEGELMVHTEIKPGDVVRENLIAQGASAKVYEAKWNGKVVALKVFDPEHISFNINEFRREVALLCLLANDNLVPCYGAGTKEGGDVFIVSEMMSKGSLFSSLRELREFMDLRMMIKFCRDISRGMRWIHSVNIIHRDLKSLNLLLNTDMTLKIIDFGLSRVVESNKLMTANMGTPAWIAPEILNGEIYTEKADVYSMGIVMWEILTIEEPFKELKIYEIPLKVCDEGYRPPIPTSLGKEYTPYIEVMKQCWDGDYTKRPSFAELEKTFTEMLEKLPEDD